MKESVKPDERRRVPRITVDFPVTVTWGRKRFRCKAGEFSEYGILLVSPNKELVGEEVRLSLVLDSNQPPMELAGVVAYTTDMGLGIRFKNIPSAEQAALKYYVQSRGIGIIKPYS